MPNFLMQYCGKLVSKKDIVFEVLAFLDDDDLARIFATARALQTMLQNIPRQPQIHKTNRPRLKFTIDSNLDPVLMAVAEPDGQKFGCMPVVIVGNRYAIRHLPLFWDLLEKSIFADIVFSIGKYPLPITALEANGLREMFWRIAFAIVDAMGVRLSCYRVIFNKGTVFNDEFRDTVSEQLLDFRTIPLFPRKEEANVRFLAYLPKL